LPPRPVAFVIASVLLGLLVSAAVKGRAKALLVGPVIVLTATLPLYAFFIVFSNLHYTRYLYFPAIGWSILLAELFFRERSTRLLHLTTALTTVTVLAIFLARNTVPWRSASAVVQVMGQSVAQGGDGRGAAAEWQARTGISLEMEMAYRFVPRHRHPAKFCAEFRSSTGRANDYSAHMLHFELPTSDFQA
jgi:hypothetical protein